MPPFDYVKARSLNSESSSFLSSWSEQQKADTPSTTEQRATNQVDSTTNNACCCFVDGYPYLWQYQVNAKDEQSIKDVCVLMFGQIVASEAANNNNKKEKVMMNVVDTSYDASLLQVQRISGGVTNILFKVSGLHSIFNYNNNNSNNALLPNDVLVRLFGAEGMINRDEETYYFSILSQHNIAPAYYGRFLNGRLEGWMNHMRPLNALDLQMNHHNNNNPSETIMIQEGIAQALAQLHATHVPTPQFSSSLDDTAADATTTTKQQHEPTLWIQLEAWYQQAITNSSYKTPHDEQRARDLNLAQYRAELDWLRNDIEQDCHLRVAFCHNDLLPANILYRNSTSNHHDNIGDREQNLIQLIDFEYGGWNYISFDIANHWNEYAGGPPDSPHPNYDTMLPNTIQRQQFCYIYLMETNKLLMQQHSRQQHDNNNNNNNNIDAANAVDAAALVTEEQVTELVTQVEKFLMPNHLYWGFWAVNQAATEGCDGYDYMEFAKSRLTQYWVCKQQQQEVLE